MVDIKRQKTDEIPINTEDEIDKSQDGVSTGTIKDHNVFSKLQRELSEDDLNNRGTQRLILSELDKFDECKKQLEQYREKYHATDKENAVLKAELKSDKAFEIINTAMFTIGSILIGLTPSILQNNETYYMTWIILGIGIITLISAISSKIHKSK